MESDYVDTKASAVKDDGNNTTEEKLFQMLTMISSQMMANYQDLQNQIAHTEAKFSAQMQQIVQDNAIFKQDIRSELQRNQSSPYLSSSSPDPIISPVELANVPSSSSVNQSTPASMSGGSSQDFQIQMLTLLNTTFSKLTTVLDTKSSESKSDWPKFSGEMKKFKSWYLAILAQMSLSPWNELYDASTNSLVLSTMNTTLNEKLYAKLLLCLEGQVLQDMVSRKHLHANGLMLIVELSQTYCPIQVPEVTAAKTAEFWGSMKCHQHETVDAYYNRFHSLLDDLEDAGEPIPTKSAIRQFIFTLGSDLVKFRTAIAWDIYLMSGRLKIGPVCWYYAEIISILFVLKVCLRLIPPLTLLPIQL
jgi:hypothetical protein